MSGADNMRVIDGGFSTLHSLPRPLDIPIRGHLSVGRFGKAEVEESAAKLLTFLQKRNTGWAPFTVLDLVLFYRKQGWDPNYMFFGLCGQWFDDAMIVGGYTESLPYVAIGDDGRYRVTNLFIEACQRL